MAQTISMAPRLDNAAGCPGTHWEWVLTLNPDQEAEHYSQLDERTDYTFGTPDLLIRRPRRLHRLCPWTSAPSVIQPGPFITGRWSHGRVAVTVAVKSLPTRQLGTKPMMLHAARAARHTGDSVEGYEPMAACRGRNSLRSRRSRRPHRDAQRARSDGPR